MVDDFMVCVDRIIASTCFESVHGGGRGGDCETPPPTSSVESASPGTVALKKKKKSSGEEECSSNKEIEILECRICQEEDEIHAMEAPCACNGTLKFAHRRCIQRWCNKKGDVTCEICNQVFSPNYSLPPARSNEVMTIDIRQWGTHFDLHRSHLLALAAAERHLLQSEYEDYADANSSSVACLCSIAIILLIILLVRQALMVTRYTGMVLESSMFVNVPILQIAGFLLPCYVVARSWVIIQSRRRRQG
ncbi:uncharacterized protein LOC107406616 isoform X2 [Ziziphus jujuba]|uniref:Uncharacterized protein LOC107406616 isoform X2 n=1 Tax=Ziziphus jujuba TaxID=326968 RepID=A0A6P3Z2V7_ZIZJJ|nr:uncharacterized protein LOC107406616 isoform X2 [Ziziphus jujuba]